MKNLNYIFFIILFSASLAKTSAQYLEVGVGLGAAVYQGDLNSPEFSTNLKSARFAAHLLGRYVYNPYLAGRLHFMYGHLEGDDANSSQDWQVLRNLNFTSSVMELALMGELYVFGFDPSNDKILSPYLAAGIAGFHFNPKTTYQGEVVELQPLGTEGQGMPGFGEKYNLYSFSIVFGGGVKMKLTDRLNLGAEILIRRTSTDYLDDVSGTYVNYNELLAGNGPLAAALGNRMGEGLGQTEPVILATGAQRGGATVNDYFYTGSIILSYNLADTYSGFGKSRGGHSIDCPTF